MLTLGSKWDPRGVHTRGSTVDKKGMRGPNHHSMGRAPSLQVAPTANTQ